MTVRFVAGVLIRFHSTVAGRLIASMSISVGPEDLLSVVDNCRRREVACRSVADLVGISSRERRVFSRVHNGQA
jgi:hypothetical protein